MKKFYKKAAAERSGEGWQIKLDGKPVRTPAGRALIAPAEGLGAAIAAEWTAQDKNIVPDSMPLTQYLTTALERVGEHRAGITHDLLHYLNTDLLSYRTSHEGISARQIEIWDPWLIWFADTYGVALAVTDRLQALTQPQEAQEAVRAALDAMDDHQFTVAQAVTALTGSVVLGLAFVASVLSPDRAFQAGNIEAIYKSEIYNEDIHGRAPQQEQAERAMRRDLDAAAIYLKLSRA